MHVTEKLYSFGVLLISTLSLTSPPPAGCGPAAPPAGPAVDDVRSRGLTASRRREQRPPGPRMAPPTSLAGSRNPGRAEQDWVAPSPNPPAEDCGEGNVQRVIHGRFSITGQLEVNLPSLGFQADSAGSDQSTSVRVQRLRGSEESWQRLQPVVECGADAMTLTVRRRRAAQLQLDRRNESPVPLSRLPPRCGYSVRPSWKDLSLTVRYNACHVSQEDDHYVLPLLWRATPVRVSCPVSQIQPQATAPSSLCCSLYGMTVKVQEPSSAEELRVNVRGEPTPLLELAELCGFDLDRRGGEMVVAAPFLTCGVTVEDGKHKLSLQIGDESFTLSCPVAPREELSQIQEPLVDISHHETRQESLEPLSWAPPFYLAPLYYPHPTYRHKYPTPHLHNGYDPPPDPAVGPQPLPDPQHVPVMQSSEDFDGSLSSTGEIEDSSQAFADLQQKRGTPVINFQRGGVTGMPYLQPPGHAFNPYYHYYHLPKIPLPGPPQFLHPSPELPKEPSSPKSHTHEFLVLPRSVQDLKSNQIHQPVSEAPYVSPAGDKSAQKPPEPHAPFPPHRRPHYFSYCPYNMADTNGATPLQPDLASRANLSTALHHKRPHIEPRNEMINQEKHSPLDLDDQQRPQPSYPPGPSSHNPVLYPYYYYYFYPYYHYYNGPWTLPSTEKHVSQTPKKALETHETTTPLTKSTSPLNPYYYSGQASSDSPPGLDHRRMDLLAPDEAGFRGVLPPFVPFSSFYSPYVTRRRPDDAFGRLSSKEDGPGASAPSASPYGSGPVSDFACSTPLGCCSYPVKDCTVGQHFVFVVPDSVLEPTAAHPTQGGKAACPLEKLTSDPDVYMVPLDGCVATHVCGQTVVHLLEVRGIHQQNHGNAAVRLMVTCTSYPGSPAEMSLHVMDPPPPPHVQSSTAMVQLRIATDQTFTSFHPKAHLPLSILRGRPLYLEVSLLDPPDPEMVLLVGSCLAYTPAPYNSWMAVYDGHVDAEITGQRLLPSPHPHHIRRIEVSTFLLLPSDMPKGGSSDWEDPQIFFLCLTDVCWAAGTACTSGPTVTCEQ